ncbi:MAG: DNA-3-methyladenine glycosylase [Polyangiaceae bacterium]|nr:DNA-3-methyladenine glycosylase [Polyangiaceae bacterium]
MTRIKIEGHSLPPANVSFEGKPLPRSFYDREVLDVAPALIGAILVHRSNEGTTAGRIVECEAYRGPEDLAAHSAGGRRTRRTEAMFGPPGHTYMFLLYGVNWAFNVVVGASGLPHAILVRAIEPIHGLDLMSKRRGVDPHRLMLTNGPGKLTNAMGLDATHYGEDLCSERLFIVGGASKTIGISARINVDYAGEHALLPWRFYERGNRYVSVAPKS